VNESLIRYYEGNMKSMSSIPDSESDYEGWNINSGNYLFTTDTK